jgi:hypothetical protein
LRCGKCARTYAAAAAGQTSGYISKLKLRWNPRLYVISQVAAFVNFEVRDREREGERERERAAPPPRLSL